MPLQAADFQVGEEVLVRSFRKLRYGTVTKVGRTRVTVKHVVNVDTGRELEKPFDVRHVGKIDQ